MESKHPLAEVFGFPIENTSDKANRYRRQKLCPFNNKSPNCTKDKQNNPLGVCSVRHNDKAIITCPIRFREDWRIIEDAALFFFGEGSKWTALPEIRLLDKNLQSAGNIDFVLVSYNDRGQLIEFASLEVQGVYISGNLRNPYEAYIEKPQPNFSWSRKGNYYPTPDYLSSSRKRLIPQVIMKGGIFKKWNKKQAIALQKSFFDTLPNLPTVESHKADIAWFLYDLILDTQTQQYSLTLVETVYTEFEAAVLKITTPEPGEITDFLELLQEKLDERLDGLPPDAPTLTDLVSN